MNVLHVVFGGAVAAAEAANGHLGSQDGSILLDHCHVRNDDGVEREVDGSMMKKGLVLNQLATEVGRSVLCEAAISVLGKMGP